MKKTERRLVKMQGIKFLRNRVAGDLEQLEDNFKDRHKTNAIKLQMKKLHQDLFLLRAAERQIPMPIRVHKSCIISKYQGRAKCKILTDETCPVCRGWLCDDEMKYCPYCGQKLWWPK